jgi:uracil-DNA glycosylase
MNGAKRDASHLSNQGVDSKKPRPNGSITSFFGAPKPKANDPRSAVSSPIATRFDKAKWVSSLTTEQKELLKLEIDTLDESWLAHLKEVLVTSEFLALKRFLKKEKESGVTIFPPEKDIYSWSHHTPLHTVKTVIIGQDPYHNPNQAHGLCFSVRPPTPAPPSLVNIFTAIKNDYPLFERPANKIGLLTPWAERGVLMLNTSLTVRAAAPASHSEKGWEKFTQKAIDTVASSRTRGVVFLVWGSHAGKRISRIDKGRHCVLQSVHPSPYSARNGFFNCGHFKKCNDWLAERYGEDSRIDWSLTAGRSIFGSSPAGKSNSDSDENKPGTDIKPTNKETRNTSKSTESLLFDEDDIGALEALAAAEEDI